MESSFRILHRGLGGQRTGAIARRLRTNASPIRSVAFYSIPAANRKYFEKCSQSISESTTGQVRQPPCGTPPSKGTDRYASVACDRDVLPRIRNETPFNGDTDSHPTVQRIRRNLNSRAGTQCATPFGATTGSGRALGITLKLPKMGLGSGWMKPLPSSAQCERPIWFVS